MKDKAKIKKIVLDIGGNEIKLSLEQAKQLNTVLGDLFNERPVYYTYPTPIIVERSYPYWTYRENTFTCDSVQMSYTDNNSCLSLTI